MFKSVFDWISQSVSDAVVKGFHEGVLRLTGGEEPVKQEESPLLLSWLREDEPKKRK